MTRERALLALAAALVLALAGVTIAQPGPRELTTFTAPTSGAASVGGEGLAHAVRYAELSLGARSTLRVTVGGAHGGVLLSLVDEADRVREVRVEDDESVARFGAVEAGDYAIRALATPPEPPEIGDGVTVRVATGGRPWALFGIAALLVLGPPLIVAGRSRRARRDARPTNR